MSSPIPTTYDQSSHPQQTFASAYDLDNPEQAVSSYSKLIHQHTLRQMELASLSTTTTHRTTNTNGSISSLKSEESVGSVGSVQS